MAEELAKIDTEVKIKEPKAPTGGRMSFSDIMGVRQPFVEKRGQIREEIKGTEGEILAGQQAQKETAAEGKMAVEQRTAEQVRGAQQKFQERMQAEPLPAFVPSQDNFRDIAGLFSLIGVVGMIAGKSSGVGAMNAMNGMLEGYRSGRNDLYRRERDVFDKNFKTMLQKHSEFRKEMDDAIKLAQTDRQAGLQAADLAAVKAGSEIVKAQIRRGDLLGAYETVKEGEAAATKALEMVNSSLNAERQAQIQAQAMATRFAQQESMLERRLTAQQEMMRERALMDSAKLDATEKKEVRGTRNLAGEIEILRATFEPRFANFKADVVGDVAAKFQSRLQDDPAMAEWWRRYENVALPERHSLFGATLTGGERESWRKASIGPGSSTKEILSWMADKDRILETRMRNFENKAMAPIPQTPATQTPSSTGRGINPQDPAGIL